MNAIEFITQLNKEELAKLTAEKAYEYFQTTVGAENAGTYPYFRTKFNNHKRSEKIEVVIPRIEIPVEDLVEEEEELPQRETKNYMKGDKLPDVPGLMPTGTLFDEVISDRITSDDAKEKYRLKYGEEMPEDMIEIGGFTRQCVDIVAGDPGSGKTYSRNILAVKAKLFAAREQNKKLIVHFISGEMRASEWAKEINSCELLKEVEVTYMLDYVGYPNYEDIFWDAFAYGDIVICDSLPAIISHMKMSFPASRKAKPETQMIFDFIRKSLKSVEENNNNVQLINQANKDGNYKGGTELPHMMSSMSFVKLDGTNRYMIFSKNRNNGKVKRKVFFSRKECGDIEFNVEAYEATYKKVNDKKETLDEFINGLDQNKQNKLNSLGEGSATEMSAYEMGTGGETPEELAELQANSIPAHLREDDEEIEVRQSMFGEQRDLEDEIAEREAETLAE